MPDEIPIPDNDQAPPEPETQTAKSSPSPSYAIPEGEFCVFGKVYARPQHASALARVYEETTRLAASEPGMIYYSISQEPEAEDTTTDDAGRGEGGGGGEKKRSRVFYFFEQYTGREAFEAHNRQPIIRKLLDEDKYIETVEDVVFTKPLKGVGSVGPAGK
ncbi:uncharacterized protein B0T23DRAFT_388407 [Neurospora hispaniola]|uniref:ABM domain-containing protein n=1 Tax=Neurospora hispaniola TaxID=588809 RepID=A0AAJ0MMW5_9PEZI|nr:hypothetical protein B0T23DRAFT_388407 [Neurospora hispaniola]